MTNSKELLTKFARLIGIPESESRLSFEIFAVQLAQKLSLGDQIEIETLGYFSNKKIKTDGLSDSQYQQAVIFSTERISEDNKDILLFFLPDDFRKDSPQIDAYMNLSFKKHLITSDKIGENDFILPSSFNEMISLIEDKVEKLISEATISRIEKTADQEYILPTDEVKILPESTPYEQPAIRIEKTESEEKNETLINSEGQKTLDSIDDYELVQADNAISEDISSEDKSDKWIFDDFVLSQEIENQDENVEIKEGFIEVRDDSIKSILSDDKDIENYVRRKEAEVSSVKPRKSILKKLVFTVLVLIILASAAGGVYLNYDQIKNFISNYIGDRPKLTEVKKTIVPQIILRTSDIPASVSQHTGEYFASMANDSMIISTAVFHLERNLIDDGTSKNEISKNDSIMSVGTLQQIGDNIYKKDSEYIVQVSSWRSKEKAEMEMKKLLDKGFDASLSEFSSSVYGTYYRVRVSGFKSMYDVNNFLNKNK